MNLPANDAFSLNAHSHSHTVKALSRSPPPSYAFLSSPSHNHNHASASQLDLTGDLSRDDSHSMSLRQRKPSASKPVNGAVEANGIANGNAHNDELRLEPLQAVQAHQTNGNGHAPVEKPKEVKPPIDWEIPRKVFHSSIGFLVIRLYTNHVSGTEVAKVLSGACAVITAVDFVRLRSRRFARVYEMCLGFLMRESEKQKTNGVIWYLMGCIFVLTFYPEDIATVSILILSWCDTTASTFGRMFGPLTPPLPRSLPLPFPSARIPLPFARRKSTAGFIAASLTGAMIVFSFWTWLSPFGKHAPSLPEAVLAAGEGSEPKLLPLAFVAVVSGILSGVAEAIDVGSLDDNLTLPIISGGVIWVLLKAIGHFFS